MDVIFVPSRPDDKPFEFCTHFILEIIDCICHKNTTKPRGKLSVTMFMPYPYAHCLWNCRALQFYTKTRETQDVWAAITSGSRMFCIMSKLFSTVLLGSPLARSKLIMMCLVQPVAFWHNGGATDFSFRDNVTAQGMYCKAGEKGTTLEGK
jgi:hypothetical protein